MIGIETTVECGGWRRALPSVRRWAGRVYDAASARAPALKGSIALLLADDSRLKALNARHRSRDKATNVLSFPSGAQAPDFLGDIAIAYETCLREAREKHVRPADHASHLLVHGLLHLVGFDHETDGEALGMEALEVEILEALGVADPYAAEAVR